MHTKEETKKQLNIDLAMILRLAETNPLYPIEDVDHILQRIKLNVEYLQTFVEQPVIGRWVQIHERSNKPIYGKIESIPEAGFYTIEGLIASQDGKVIKRAVQQRACLFVSDDVARALEFANDINTIKPQPHKRGIDHG